MSATPWHLNGRHSAGVHWDSDQLLGNTHSHGLFLTNFIDIQY